MTTPADASLPLSVLTALDEYAAAVRRVTQFHTAAGESYFAARADRDAKRAALLHSLREMARLATFGAWALEELRGDNLGCDINGGDAQDEAVRLGILTTKVVTEPCGESCQCAELADFPTDCLHYADDVRPLIPRLAARTPQPETRP
jgi:hypothetical protein